LGEERGTHNGKTMAESVQTDVSDIGSMYESHAPEMKPLDEGEKKSVK
jgi:hypothetical protein